MCSLCVCAVYMGPDCQAPYIETARVHGWVQEMTVIMPNVASVSLVVMDMVCNRVEMWPHCSKDTASAVPSVRMLKLDMLFFTSHLYLFSLPKLISPLFFFFVRLNQGTSSNKTWGHKRRLKQAAAHPHSHSYRFTGRPEANGLR